jgi:hypothetical protein
MIKWLTEKMPKKKEKPSIQSIEQSQNSDKEAPSEDV